MNTKTALKYFGTERALAEFLGVSRQAVNLWKHEGAIPFRRALQLQERTKGKLKVDGRVYLTQAMEER